MERKTAIRVLKDHKNWAEMDKRIVYAEALTIAINSLMTNEAYQLEYERTTKNDLAVDCVARQDIERYIEGFINEYTPKEELEFINLELDGLKHLPSVTPQEPRKGYLSIDDVMAVFDDFMCGEVDEDGTETFFEMLKDKADMREVEK